MGDEGVEAELDAGAAPALTSSFPAMRRLPPGRAGGARRAGGLGARGSAPVERAAGDGFTTYVACSHQGQRQASTVVRSAQPKAAFFVSKRRDVTYKVCVKFPGQKKRLCASGQDAPKGEKQRVTITTARAGKHKVTGTSTAGRSGAGRSTSSRGDPSVTSGVSDDAPPRATSARPSFELGPDHVELQKWVHDFAADVVRPAAAEWDEREEFPWPVRRGGRQDRPLLARLLRHPGLRRDRARAPDHHGGAVLGRRRASAWPSSARRSPRPGVAANGTPEQIGEWVPQMFGTPGDLKLAAFCSSEPDAGSDVGAMRTRATYDEATDEWVLNGTKTWATNGGIADVHVVTAVVDPELRARGQASFVVPPGTHGAQPGPEVRQARHPRLAHRRGRPRPRAGPRPLPARRQGEARRPAGPRPRGHDVRRRRQRLDGDVRADPAGGRRPGGRHRARGVRGGAGLRQDPRAVRQADHREPGASRSCSPT